MQETHSNLQIQARHKGHKEQVETYEEAKSQSSHMKEISAGYRPWDNGGPGHPDP